LDESDKPYFEGEIEMGKLLLIRAPVTDQKVDKILVRIEP
jgi:hypothetical protein